MTALRYIFKNLSKRFLPILLLLAISILNASGQDYFKTPKFSSLGVNEGLSQNSIWSVLQSFDGFIWIGTSDGINRYDGIDFKTYRHEDGNKCSITGQNFPRLFEDKNHQLWLSDDHGLSVYNKYLDCFKSVYLLKNSPMEFYSNNFIGEDSQGNLLVFLGDNILLSINIITHKISKKLEVKLPINCIRPFLLNEAVIIDKKAYLTFDENYFIELNLNTLAYKFIRHSQIMGTAIVRYSNKELLFFFGDSICIYNTFSGKEKCLLQKGEINEQPNFLPNHATLYQGNIWLSSKTGIVIFNPKINGITKHLKSFNNNEDEDYDFIFSTYADHSGNLWICTNGDGIKIYSPFKNKFEHYKTKSKKKNLIKAICVDNEGLIYTAPFKEQIVVYNPKDGSISEPIKINPKLLITGSITSICNFPNNKIGITLNSNLFVYDPKLKSIKLIIDEANPNLGGKQLGKLGAYSTFLKISEDCYYLNLGSQIIKLVFSPEGEITYESIFEFNPFSSTSLALDESGKLWMGTIHGIYLIDVNAKTSTPILKGSFVKCILKAKSNLIYVATQKGIYIFKDYKQIAYYNDKNGLPADFTYGLLEDPNNNIWISHNKGLTCFDPITRKFKNYTLKDGLQSNEFNTGAFFKDENGKLYFGGINGVNAFNGQMLALNANEPKIQFTSIKIFDEPYKTDSNISAIHQLNLSYQNNTLWFGFAAMSFVNPELNQYAYKLEGYDPTWIYCENKHDTRYANLPFGNYVLKVKAANADGVWSSTSKDLSITIYPPYWRTNWFYFLATILILILIATVIYYFYWQQQTKQKRLREIQEKLEFERLRISRDLHDHVGAQLSYLITNIEWILANPDALNEEETNKRMNSLSATGRQAIITLRQTIWAIHNKEISVEEFSDRFKQFAKNMLAFNTQIHFIVEEDIDDSIMLQPGAALNLFRICQEALNNSIKHAQCSEIKIVVKADIRQAFYFEMLDNGIGFSLQASDKDAHYGLQNMTFRAEECLAKIKLESEIGVGTRLILSLD